MKRAGVEVFQVIGVSLNHPCIDGVSLISQPALGRPTFMEFLISAENLKVGNLSGVNLTTSKRPARNDGQFLGIIGLIPSL